MSRNSTKDMLIMADQHYKAGDQQSAARLYSQILAQDPHCAESLLMMGVISFNIQKFDVAENFLNSATQLQSPLRFMSYKVLADIQRSRGRMAEAIDNYKKSLNIKPDFIEALANLAAIYLSQNNLDEAQFFNRKVLSLSPNYHVALYNMATIHEIRGENAEAEKFYNAAILASPSLAQAYAGLGRVQKKMSQPKQAIENLKKSIELKPTAEAYAHIGEALQDRNEDVEALQYYKKALAINPNNTEYLNNIGGLYSRLQQYREASNHYRRVLDVEPDNPSALNNMASSLKAFGQMEEAISYHKKSLQIRPNHAGTYTNLLLSMVYAPSVSAEEQAKTAREFGEGIANPVFKNYVFNNDRNPNRRLKIGYVSPDFKTHSVNFFFEPLLNRHDRKNFEIYGYASVEKKDGITARLEKSFDHWRDIFTLDDEEAADLIHQDGIDILIDMAGHTGFNRLLTFARKPAPVQVTWLGYPATTGVTAIDYRIVDPHTVPAGMNQEWSAETLWRLPDVFCCYSPGDKIVDVIDHPPFEDNGYITFGCFNNFSKVTDAVLASWLQILKRVPGSKLFLEIACLDQFESDLIARLQAIGFDLASVILEQRKPNTQFIMYNRIDIALDPFPCNGGTTSMDCLWMGVPIIALAGNSFVSRMGVSFLTNSGLPQLIADTTDDYIEKAVALASDLDGLRAIRHNLRDKVRASPLMDQERFIKNMEAAYRKMWQLWCAEN